MTKKEKPKKKQKNGEEFKICPQCGNRLQKNHMFCFHCDWIFVEEPKTRAKK